MRSILVLVVKEIWNLIIFLSRLAWKKVSYKFSESCTENIYMKRRSVLCGVYCECFFSSVFVLRNLDNFYSTVWPYYNDPERLYKISLQNIFGECLNFEISYRFEKFLVLFKNSASCSLYTKSLSGYLCAFLCWISRSLPFF